MSSASGCDALSVRDLGVTSPSCDIPVVANVLVRALVAAAAELGVSCREALASLDVCDEEPLEGLASHRFERLLRAVADALVDPAAGARVGSLIHLEHLNVVGPILLSATSAREALAKWEVVRRTALGGPAWLIGVMDDGVLVGVDRCAPLVAQFCTAIACNVALDYYGSSCAAELRACLQGPPPAHEARLRRAFKVELCFDAPRNGVWIPRARFEQLQTFADPQLAERLTALVRGLVGPELACSWRRRVELALRAQPRVASVEIGALAALWQVSPRSLRRWLGAEGTSFRVLREQVAMEVAQRLLTRPLSVARVAHVVGFADENSFRRAFKRAFGLAPGAQRHVALAGMGNLQNRQDAV